MSIVLPTDTFATITPVVRHLERLKIGRGVEVVIVVPFEEMATGFASTLENVVIQGVQSIYPLSAARAAGIRAAAAPYVFMGETHSFPRAGMFEELLRAHESGWGVAVPIFENDNPDGMVSWAGFINGYASWTAGRHASEINYAPLFNCSYQRSFLVGLGADLDRTLKSGENVMAQVRSAGLRVWLEPAARIGHVNMSELWTWLNQRIVAGRVIASVRAARWSLVRRMLFAAGAPLIPVVLLSRHRNGIMRTINVARIPARVLLVMGVGMIAQAMGEMAGYLLGNSSRADRRYDEFEVRQLSFASGGPSTG